MPLSPQDEERLRKEFIETAHTVMSISSEEAGHYADWWLARMKEERARLVREVEGMMKTITEPTEVDGIFRGLQVMQTKINESHNQALYEVLNLIKNND